MKFAAGSILLALLLSIGDASAASFDCRRAQTPDEIAICDNRDLNDMDVKMATLLDIAKGFMLMGERGATMDAQREWLARRRKCGANVECLRRFYRQRIDELEQAIGAIRERSQF